MEMLFSNVVFQFFFIFLGSAMTHLHMIPENFPAMERPNLSFEPLWFELCELFLPWKRYQDHFWMQNFRGNCGIFTACKTSRLSLESKRCAWMPRLSGRSLGWTSYLTLCDIYLKVQFLVARPHPPLGCGHGDAVFQRVFQMFSAGWFFLRKSRETKKTVYKVQPAWYTKNHS